jgi:hypothetical protein
MTHPALVSAVDLDKLKTLHSSTIAPNVHAHIADVGRAVETDGQKIASGTLLPELSQRIPAMNIRCDLSCRDAE